MFKRVSLFIAIQFAFLVPNLLLAAEFNVGDSRIIIDKVKGNIVLKDNGRNIAAGNIVNSEFKTGSILDLNANSVVWLKVIKRNGGEASYLKLVANSCGTRCSFNQEKGTVTTTPLNNDIACKKAISFFERARGVANLPKSDSGSDSTYVYFRNETGTEYEERLELNMPPAVSAPSFVSKRDIGGYRATSITSRITTTSTSGLGSLNESPYVPGSTTTSAGGGGASASTPSGSADGNNFGH